MVLPDYQNDITTHLHKHAHKVCWVHTHKHITCVCEQCTLCECFCAVIALLLVIEGGAEGQSSRPVLGTLQSNPLSAFVGSERAHNNDRNSSSFISSLKIMAASKIALIGFRLIGF